MAVMLSVILSQVYSTVMDPDCEESSKKAHAGARYKSPTKLDTWEECKARCADDNGCKFWIHFSPDTPSKKYRRNCMMFKGDIVSWKDNGYVTTGSKDCILKTLEDKTEVTIEPEFDDCDPNPCQNGGSCTDIGDGFSCQCVDGFEGLDCSTNSDDCNPNLCQNGGVCVDGDGDFTCTCVDGYTGDSCQTEPVNMEHLEGWGFIESYSMNGKCVDVDGDPGIGDNANVQLGDCEKDNIYGTDQLWKLMTNGQLVSRVSGKCMDVHGMCKNGLFDRNPNVQIRTCEAPGTTDNHGRQSDHFWQFNDADALGHFSIFNQCVEKCLDVVGWSVDKNGQQINMLRCEEMGDTGKNGFLFGLFAPKSPSDHFWKFDTVVLDPCQANPCQNGGVCSSTDGSCTCVGGFIGERCESVDFAFREGWGFIESYSMPGKCLNVDGYPGLRNGANVNLWDCETDTTEVSDQLWKLVPNGQIVNRVSGKCLDVAGWGCGLDLFSGNVQISHCESPGTTNRDLLGKHIPSDHFWEFIEAENGAFSIHNKCPGIDKCVNVHGWSDAKNGKQIDMKGCESFGQTGVNGWFGPRGASDHFWKFVPVTLDGNKQY